MPSVHTLQAQLKAHEVRVLVVDDDLHIGMGLKDILQDAGYAVETVACGADAYEYLERETISMLVVDYSLPDATGVEIARFARTVCPWTPTILMTGHDPVEIVERDSSPLLAAFLRKPIDVQTILKTLESTLHRQCDHLQIPRFLPHPESVPVPAPAPAPAPASAALPRPVPRASTAETPPTVLPVSAMIPTPPSTAPLWMGGGVLVCTGFLMGWMARGMSQQRAEAVATTPIVESVAVPPAPILMNAVSSPAAAPLPPISEAPTPVPPVLKALPKEPDWEAGLSSEDPVMRLKSARVLIKNTRRRDKAVPVLVALLDDADTKRRLTAMETLSASGVRGASLAAPVAARLKDSDSALAAAAATFLGRLGSFAEPVLPALIDALNEPRPAVKSAAQQALLRLAPAPVPLLVQKLADPTLRMAAIDTLGLMGPSAREALPSLSALENDPEIGFAAMKAAALIDPPKQP